jgi:hypothetical protein
MSLDVSKLWGHCYKNQVKFKILNTIPKTFPVNRDITKVVRKACSSGQEWIDFEVDGCDGNPGT